MSPTIHFYICEDCKEPIHIDNWALNEKKTPYCGVCSARRLAKELPNADSDTISRGWQKKMIRAIRKRMMFLKGVIWASDPHNCFKPPLTAELRGLSVLGTSGVIRKRGIAKIKNQKAVKGKTIRMCSAATWFRFKGRIPLLTNRTSASTKLMTPPP